MQIDGYSFTQRMQATLWDAVAEAQSLHHEYIGTEHLLLALLHARDGRAASALRSLGVDSLATANRVLAIVRRGTGSRDASSGALLPFSSRAKKVLELAKGEARALNHPLIGTEHLLLGLVAETKGVAAQVLLEAGVDFAKTRSAVLAILGTTSDDERHRTNDVPAGEQPAFLRVMLEYNNGAVVSKQFPTIREAIVFLEEQRRV